MKLETVPRTSTQPTGSRKPRRSHQEKYCDLSLVGCPVSLVPPLPPHSDADSDRNAVPIMSTSTGQRSCPAATQEGGVAASERAWEHELTIWLTRTDRSHAQNELSAT